MAVSKKIAGTITRQSWIRKMFEDGLRLKKEIGAANVFDFSLGNPNVEPPAVLKKVLLEVATDERPGVHAYMPNAGFPETRAAVADHVGRQQGVTLTGDHVIMTCGAAGALNVILKTILDPGDEVLVMVPYFVEYLAYVDNHGGVAKPVRTTADFSLDLQAIEAAITERTKAVLINSPNNPTGQVYGEEELRRLAGILVEKGRKLGRAIHLISDEPYDQIVYDGLKLPSLLRIYQNSIIANSFSKTLSLPGERIGFIAVHPATEAVETLVGGLVMCNRMLGFVNAPAFMQRVLPKMLASRVNVEEYQRKRDLLCRGLAERGYDFVKPGGAFYLFPKTPIADDVEFVRRLQGRNILAVPGSGFGSPGYFRIAYCVEDATIVGAMKGFGEVMMECR
ncbi:MAG TPA: pyridoxal phosphate-dependent aminotransferase [Syntrophales bacterium]|nr:pyridoxal phosphate-dependent aminotransferase [Syntrophales bacterium]HOX94879.1 pyridoxal phosphate-dependent aminotransferase [Syntrophales bacterium]HPI55856.1 pyridoxal phosphate-dependent aminotransferase [Syntrophales bacterium]HPN23653.1 pyridoxal phosphate-dependent aminotransferase [Syntrophales bacterium]HQM27822.1 pyridoxal phosphate-dependent aminotransferase [Syntrophales bacterium]